MLYRGIFTKFIIFYIALAERKCYNFITNYYRFFAASRKRRR